MNYTLYCLEFINGVHFGRGNLDSSEITFHADTLFSALFQEALKMKKQDRFLKQVSDGKIIFSDAFPYIGKNYYIPKPMIAVQPEDESKQGDSRQKKKFKNLKYISVSTLADFVNGTFPEEHMEDMKYLGLYDMKVSVGIHGMEEPEPFRVNTWNFNTGTGLYVLAGYENESDRELLDELFESLQYTGIGGKKSSGLGRFIYKVCKVPEDMMGYLKKKSEKNILLSTALPEDEELEQVTGLQSAGFCHKGGFLMTVGMLEDAVKACRISMELYHENPTIVNLGGDSCIDPLLKQLPGMQEATVIHMDFMQLPELTVDGIYGEAAMDKQQWKNEVKENLKRILKQKPEAVYVEGNVLPAAK